MADHREPLLERTNTFTDNRARLYQEEHYGPDGVPMKRRLSTFPRTITEPLAHAIEYITDTDGEWTRQLIKEYAEMDDQGPEGDVPEQPPFAQEVTFWEMGFIAAVLGAIMGIAALAFMNVIDEIPKRWTDTDDFEDPEDGGFYKGKVYWIYVTTGTGLIVGVLRWISSYPNDLPGFFKEVNSCHVNPKHAPMTILLSAISIAGGAALGPEQAMGNLGGGLGTLITEHIKYTKDEADLIVLTGMSAAMGALFPTPILGVLMIHELGNPPKSFMESTLLMSVGGIVAFLVFYSFENLTYLDHMTANYTLSGMWDFDIWNCGTAVVIGLVSAALSMVCLVGIGIVKQFLMRIKDRCDKTKFLNGQIVICVLGGLMIGLVNYALPLSTGNGKLTLTSTVRNWHELDTNLLICTIFAKMFTLAVSMNCGFIGGFIFPLISIGTMAGVVAHKEYHELPLGLCVGCFLAAVPSAITPMPFTMVGLSCFLMFFGLQQTVPIFISCTVAYLMFTGIGIFGALQARGNNSGGSQRGDDKKTSHSNSHPGIDEEDEEEAMYSKRKQKMPEDTLAALNYANALT